MSQQVTLEQAMQAALRNHAAGQLAEAEKIYRQILAAQPNHAAALRLLGVIAMQVGRYEAAIDLIRRAISSQPGEAAFYCSVGEAYRRSNRLPEAVTALEHAIRLDPGLPGAYYNLGVALAAQGKLDEAIAAYSRAIQIKGDHAGAYFYLGNALRDQGKFDQAAAAYMRATHAKPDYAAAFTNLGNALSAQGKFKEGLEACTRALQLDDGLPEGHMSMGTILYKLFEYDEAIDEFQRAIVLKADYAEAYSNVGNTLKELGRLDEAGACYQRALSFEPNDRNFLSNQLYALYFNPAYDAEKILAEHRNWNARHAGAFKGQIEPHSNDPAPDRRLRIGYVGADFREHCQTHFVAPLLSHHDHANFEIFCYSNVANPDDVTDRLRAYADAWRIIRRMSDDHTAELIRQDKIDILIDLTVHMADNRLLVFARKPAPVQMTWLGYPGTTGLETIDYRLSDPYLDPFDAAQGGSFDAAQDRPPDNDRFYSEATLRLPETFWCYDPLTDALNVNELPALKNGVVTFGCLNNFCKISDDSLHLWAAVLRTIPNSTMLLLAPRGSARRRVLDFFRQERIDPARIEFCGRQPMRDYLKLYHRIDVGLDALPYNGHTSSLDSFWMGVPVVTLVGKTVVGRAGFSQLSNLGMTELVAWDPEQYVRIVQQLTGDLPKLAALRAGLRERMTRSPLMDAPRFARNMEAAYRHAWRRWCEGGINTTS